VELRYPDLAGVSDARMSDDEKDLSRYVQFVFHPRARLDKHLARIQSCEAIESAHVVPTPSLPSPGGPAISVSNRK
jgi:hypothetical protein